VKHLADWIDKKGADNVIARKQLGQEFCKLMRLIDVIIGICEITVSYM
jgi:hypothetical protein